MSLVFSTSKCMNGVGVLKTGTPIPRGQAHPTNMISRLNPSPCYYVRSVAYLTIFVTGRLYVWLLFFFLLLSKGMG